MPIRFRCSNCRQMLSIATRKAGHQVACPQCGAEITVPEEEHPTSDDSEKKSPAFEGNLQKAEQNQQQENFFAEEDQPPLKSDSSPEETYPEGAVAPLREYDSNSELGIDSGEKDDEGFSLGRSDNQMEEMDLTPMVDVTFLLLIFFMITASFSLQKTIEIPKPDPDKKGATQSIQTLDDLLDNSIKVDIDQRNVIYVDDERIENPSSLADTLRARSRTEHKSELVLVADPRALHETVVAVVDAANAAGMQRIRLASTSKSNFE